MHYIICLSKDYVYGLMSGLFAWISLDCFVVDLFCDNDQDEDVLLTSRHLIDYASTRTLHP